jgi:hypothetical protein
MRCETRSMESVGGPATRIHEQVPTAILDQLARIDACAAFDAIAAAPSAGAEESRDVGWAECRAQPEVLVTPRAPTRSRHGHVRQRTDRSKRRAQPAPKGAGDGR